MTNQVKNLKTDLFINGTNKAKASLALFVFIVFIADDGFHRNRSLINRSVFKFLSWLVMNAIILF